MQKCFKNKNKTRFLLIHINTKPVIRLLEFSIVLPLLAAAGAGRYTAATLCIVPERPWSMSDVTRLLSAIDGGDPHASEQLLPLVYDELRRLAAQRLAPEKPGQTLQATALVHEAYLRLVDVQQARHWNSRGHFFAAAAEAMRRILVERARLKGRIRHGGGLRRVDLLDAEVAAPDEDEQILLLDEALTRLAVARPQAAELVKLRFFAGLTLEAIAPILDMSPRSSRRLWAFARAWLRRDMERFQEPPP
jgi:RNA polymerase sigma factor (TIGR02999 family)